MITHDPIQAGFADALLAPEQSLPPGLITWNGSNPSVRFDVYRNNVVVSLTEALSDGFPVTRALVGETFFAAMARCFASEYLPCSPILTDYGDALPDFIAAFPPAHGLPYLSDLARLERARVKAYHAADVRALTVQDLAHHLADPQRLPAARLALHPACTLLVSEHAVVSLWAAHQGQGRIEDVDLCRSESALVLRDGDEVLIWPLSPGIDHFFAALAAGAPLSEAAEVAAATAADFDLARALALLIHHGGIAAWQPSGEPTT
ncbi:HvfC/BufC N-terminal domain-containing protein [Thiocapsa bogorovii]|uniref:HvfC/BufC N-terminal domain-containing protein n=1 Tax=Thiocapsa bogorovii TaxID=521689 RepID=UPI001E51B24E|nr:DNA-binding domain-containing protein [Thiocapsa bogorovii]UHD16294.1 putative DNA-binding domain-containing protein [Thiocapsa bogorovii]